MSTAGKFLTVVVMLSLLVWIVLAAGVSRYNTNGNTRLHELAQQVEKLEVDLQQTQDDIVAQLRPNQCDSRGYGPHLHVVRARQVELEKASSQINDTLSGVRFQLATLEDTIKGAQTALEHRNTEHQELTAELAKMRSDVKDLMADCSQRRNRLASLRNDFQNTYRSNIEMAGKVGRSDNARRGGTN